MEAKTKVDREAGELIAQQIGRLADNFWSPNVSDSNFEPANIVDALSSIAKAIWKLAEVLGKKPKP
jgi:hypothetical protein